MNRHCTTLLRRTAPKTEVSLIAYEHGVVCFLVCLVLGLPLIAQTTSESAKHESADAVRASSKTVRTDTAPQVGDASGDRDGKKVPQLILDSKPDIFDAFLATRQGRGIVGAVSVAIGMVFLLIPRIVSYGNKRSLKNERTCGNGRRLGRKKRTVRKYEAVIRREGWLFLGSSALMLGTICLVSSIFPVQ